MSGKYVLKKAANGQYHFNLKAGNGEVILSSETYKGKDSALGGIASVQANSQIDGRFQRKTSTAQQPYFVLVAGNGEPIGRSEMYSSESAMENGIRSVKENGSSTDVDDQTGE